MDTRKTIIGMLIIILSCLTVNLSQADDTCTFMVTANDIPPNIVFLLDNGAEMEQIVWPQNFNNSTDYTPNQVIKTDVVQNNGTGNGFYLPNGYSIVKSGNNFYLVDVPSDLVVANHAYWLQADGNGNNPVWTINGHTITLPAVPSNHVDGNGIIDNATNFRYSANYLNWLFYSGAYTGNGSDLPTVSRFYYAKSALMTVAKMTANQAKFGINTFTANASGASNVQPLGLVVNTPLATNPANNTLQSNFVNTINNLGTVTYSPLAEGLASVGGYYASSSSRVADPYCQKLFSLVVSPGMSSQDQIPASQSSPSSFSDFDGDQSIVGEGNIKENNTTYAIPVNLNGSAYLDDVAYYLYNNDIVPYQPGVQNVATYTVGFMGNHVSNLFLINTANNGNGNTNLYDTTDPDYGKYFFNAQSPDQLAATLLNAVNSIITRTNSFTAPVVPVTRTTSGNYIYLAFFKPQPSNFWQGNVTKFGLSSNLAIVDANGDPATYPNGAMVETAKPYWQTTDWATPTKSNYIFNANRNIYTYLGTNKDLTASSNAFNSTNTNLTSALLGNPTHTVAQIVNYIRGADVLDENSNSNTTENRAVITGDVLHSQPVVFQYDANTSYVFFASNDGMLHAVRDSDGVEAWAFIPPDMLPKLKNLVEGIGHQIYVDSSPKIYFKDSNANGIVDSGEQVILVCGERQGGYSYFALDITNPVSPRYLWRIDQVTSQIATPDQVIATMGQSWSEPQFGLVKTSSTDTVGTPVFFIGGGYMSDISLGKAIFAINTLTGQLVKSFTDPSMNFSIPSNVLAIDEDDNGFIDKVYVGDLGSQVWRLGKYTDASGNTMGFPDSDENINDWAAQIIFLSDASHARKFFYAPSLTLEKGYDLLFIGTGDRVNACSTPTYTDRFYCIKDTHVSTTLNETNLVDVTASTSLTPTSMASIGGWFIQLAAGEKVLATNTVFYKIVYFTTFTPTTDPCTPGGDGRVYAMQYNTGATKVDLNHDGNLERSIVIGGGIPSSPVMVVTDKLNPARLMVAEGSTNPDLTSLSFNAGVVSVTPLTPAVNFIYRWWKQILNF